MNPRPTASSGKRRHRTRLVEQRELAPGTIEVDLQRPEGFSFLPGQRIRLHHDNLHRDYSLANGPEDPVLTLCIRLVEGGAFSKLLRGCRADTPFDLTGPHGYFVFHPSERPAVWVATGTGVAPFAAMCRAAISGADVIHGVRSARHCYYADLFRRVAGNYTACISNPDTKDSGFFHGRVTRYLQERLSAGAYDFYLCGRGEMIREATLIVDEQFPGSRVFTEIFY